MSSEIDQPRQRTVAELLAEHGGGTGGRRRRRREEDADGGFGPSDGPRYRPDPQLSPPAPHRSPLWEPQPPPSDIGGYEPDPYRPGPHTTGTFPRRSFSDSPLREPRPFDTPPPEPAHRSGSWTTSSTLSSDSSATTAWRPLSEPSADVARRPFVPPPPREGSGPAFSPVATPFRKPPASGDGFGGAASGGVGGTRIGPAHPPRPAPRPSPDPVRDRPTDLLPPVRDDSLRPSDPLTRPITPPTDGDRFTAQQPPVGSAATSATQAIPGLGKETADSPSRPDLDAGPATMIGTPPPGAEAWHRRRVEAARPNAAPAPPDGSGPVRPDEPPAGLGESGPQPKPVDTASESTPGPGGDQGTDGAGTGSRVVESASQAWAAVVAQWIAGAVSGAVLWVAFRFLWRSLPVVALAAAALVTAGLVVIVRALLHNDDKRTTIFAVIVGLLLTVSPAILALVGR